MIDVRLSLRIEKLSSHWTDLREIGCMRILKKLQGVRARGIQKYMLMFQYLKAL
jgi:hypothetical protein